MRCFVVVFVVVVVATDTLVSKEISPVYSVHSVSQLNIPHTGSSAGLHQSTHA